MVEIVNVQQTLINIVDSEYSINCKEVADSQPSRSIVSIFAKEVPNFSKYDLAKAFIRWCKDNDSSKLSTDEIEGWKSLINDVNKALK